MRVKFLRGIFWKGEHLKAGDIVELSQKDYEALIALNAVEKVEYTKLENSKVEETIKEKGGKK
jgi:hypothetical protein